MGERGPQTRGPREIEDFVGWEMPDHDLGHLDDESLADYLTDALA
jgi:hypothetical protein